MTCKINMQTCSIETKYTAYINWKTMKNTRADKVIELIEANKPKSSVDVETSLLLVWFSIDFPIPEAFRSLESNIFFSVSVQWQRKNIDFWVHTILLNSNKICLQFWKISQNLFHIYWSWRTVNYDFLAYLQYFTS